EPADEYKGDFARTYFYMFTIYDDINWSVTQTDRNFMFDGSSYPSLRPWAYTMLLEWSK
ncbi:MAG TPA: ribonuclease, partial [Porphyromonadaceae bacterium]|nr:ribonuclease [Porphyromonadaceae bacterium]